MVEAEELPYIKSQATFNFFLFHFSAFIAIKAKSHHYRYRSNDGIKKYTLSIPSSFDDESFLKFLREIGFGIEPMKKGLLNRLGVFHSWKREPESGESDEKSGGFANGETTKSPFGGSNNFATDKECSYICDTSYSPVCATNDVTNKTFINYCDFMKSARCCEKYKGKLKRRGRTRL